MEETQKSPGLPNAQPAQQLSVLQPFLTRNDSHVCQEGQCAELRDCNCWDPPGALCTEVPKTLEKRRKWLLHDGAKGAPPGGPQARKAWRCPVKCAGEFPPRLGHRQHSAALFLLPAPRSTLPRASCLQRATWAEMCATLGHVSSLPSAYRVTSWPPSVAGGNSSLWDF